MPLEVIQGDHNIGIHNGSADHGLFHIFAAPHRHGNLVGALESVRDDYMAAGGIGRKAIDIGGFQVIQRIFPGTDIHGVGIGEEGFAAQILNEIHHHPGIARAQIGHVAQFTEMDLNGHIFVLEVDLIHPRRQQQPCQLLGNGLAAGRAEGSKIYLGCHKKTS